MDPKERLDPSHFGAPLPLLLVTRLNINDEIEQTLRRNQCGSHQLNPIWRRARDGAHHADHRYETVHCEEGSDVPIRLGFDTVADSDRSSRFCLRHAISLEPESPVPVFLLEYGAIDHGHDRGDGNCEQPKGTIPAKKIKRIKIRASNQMA